MLSPLPSPERQHLPGVPHLGHLLIALKLCWLEPPKQAPCLLVLPPQHRLRR